VERFEELANYPNVTELEIMDYRSRSFVPLGALRDLRRLSVIHFPHVSSFEPLSELRALEELVLETLPSGDASGKFKLVGSFRPLAGLSQLRVLKLAGVGAEDNDLSPLGGLTGLQELALGNLFPQRQFARLLQEISQYVESHHDPAHTRAKGHDRVEPSRAPGGHQQPCSPNNAKDA